MDTSEKYVKMCESAKEIERRWNFKNGDYIFNTVDEEARVWFGYPSKEYSEYTWLPRQDQFQEICIDFYIQNYRVSRSEAFVHF
jgi:hypothetical protein